MIMLKIALGEHNRVVYKISISKSAQCWC